MENLLAIGNVDKQLAEIAFLQFRHLLGTHARVLPAVGYVGLNFADHQRFLHFWHSASLNFYQQLVI